jgi:hypothetical protein
MKRRKRSVRKYPAPPATERFNMVIDGDLKRWATEYARRRRTTVTAMVIEQLVILKERDEEPYVEQI